MCSSKSKKVVKQKSSSINGLIRPVLQPNCINRSPLLETERSIDHHHHQPYSSSSSSRCSTSFKYTSSAIVDAPGTIAAARREQVAITQEQRKLRISHYGRTSSSDHHHQYSSSLPTINNNNNNNHFIQRCSFITPNSDPIYVAYHDEEWGVPVHDDKMLFELLVLTGAQVGSDWSSVLRRREDFRKAFSRFDADIIVSKFSEEKKINLITSHYALDLTLVRAVVDNSKRILEIKKEYGSFDKYVWGFVNDKPIVTQYKWCHKIPAKTSKSETISKDMVRRGFRHVGPTIIHSFMQAAGLTNDHLITCPTHHINLIH
ncbi:hypothetical protein ABFS82_13G194900 [Erythranthe guttata]|uniref:DNA-3-methyladenine glycosylase I n=1 Tax=Erythranthe guttata TaxID=4155 RepID=A0A022RSW8_ERYGU|nr:hypothetical protein MIMGU_mgv1a008239mg [Erythranthe guttata]